jgi:hypothetical protein
MNIVCTICNFLGLLYRFSVYSTVYAWLAAKLLLHRILLFQGIRSRPFLDSPRFFFQDPCVPLLCSVVAPSIAPASRPSLRISC